MNDKLKNVTIDEMQKEIKRRLSVTPKTKENLDWYSVKNFVESSIIKNKIKDYEHYLFETVMETMYGPDIWDWWNSNVSEAPQSDQ